MITNNPEESKALARQFMQGFRADGLAGAQNGQATVIELVGDLGSGKTTFMQGIGEYFGLSTPLSSPTFVIGKHYDLPDGFPWKRLIHIDAYRIENEKELQTIGWARYASDQQNIIFIEWPANMRTDLAAAKRITFKHINENQRDIEI